MYLLACQCNPNGTDGDCDPLTGMCTCLPDVTGDLCDQCEPGFWGLSQGPGCSPCDCCNNGSTTNTCDQVRIDVCGGGGGGGGTGTYKARYKAAPLKSTLMLLTSYMAQSSPALCLPHMAEPPSFMYNLHPHPPP